MDQQRWIRVKEIVFAALDMKPAARRAFVLEAAGKDTEVREEALSLLEQDLKTSYVEEEGSRNLPTAIELSIANYEILGVVGRGGMGTVYRSRDTRLDRLVALKVLLPHLIAGDTARNRFLHEARAAARLDDPNICTVYEVGETESGVPFIATTFIDGVSVRGLLRRRRPTIPETIDIVSQILSGLRAAHSAGIVHRDIKPSNIMITEGGRVKIVDFGIAKILGDDNVTKTGATLGTISYMSPERIRGLPIDHRADIWAVGVILYEMLSGRRPFAAGDHETTGYQVVHEVPEPLVQLNPGVPSKLIDIVDKCLAKDPEDRYPDVDAIIRELEQMDVSSVTGDPEVDETPQRLPSAYVRWSLAVIAVIVAVILGGLMFFGNDLGGTSRGRHDSGAANRSLSGSARFKLLVAPYASLTRSVHGDEQMIKALINRDLWVLASKHPNTVVVGAAPDEHVHSHAEALAVLDSADAFMLIWGRTVSNLGQIEIESRITTRAELPLFDDSLLAIPAAFQLPPWSGTRLIFRGDDILQTRVTAAQKTAETAASVLLVQRALQSDRPETALLAIRDDSTNPGIAELRAATLVRLGLVSEAQEYLDWAKSSFPAHSPLWSIHASQLAISDDVRGAMEMARRAIQIDQRYVFAHLQLAHLSHLLGDEGSATEHVEQAYHVAAPDVADQIAVALVRRYVALRHFQKAEVLLSKLIPAGDGYSKWHDLLVDLYLAEGRMSEANFLLRELTERNPGDPRPLERLARYHRRQGQMEAAYNVVSKLAAIDPARGYRLEGEWLLEAENLSKAAQAFELAIASDNALDWTDYELLGDILVRLGRYEEAIDAYRAGTAEANNDDALAAKLADAYLHAGMEAKAARIAHVKMIDNPALGHKALMETYRQMGMFDHAVFHAGRHLAIAPHDPYRNSEMAITLYLARRYEESFPFFERAIESLPANASNYIRYAFALHRSGRTEDAYRQLESYREYRRSEGPADTSGFSDQIVDFLLGDRTEDELLRPPFQTEGDSLWMMASGHAILGMSYLTDFARSLEHEAPDTAHGIDLLRQALRYGKHPNATRDLVLAELARLEE